MVLALLRLAFEEDLGSGDISSEATVPVACAATALVVARQPLVAAGVSLLDSVFSVMAERGRAEEEASTLSLLEQVADGARLQPGDLLCRIDGSARALLAVERTLLNLLGHLCGVASATSAVLARVEAVSSSCRVLDTRKTTTGQRALEKYAVRCGGGHNHRMGLYDAVLIKDNHVVAAGGVGAAVRAATKRAPAGVVIEVECDDLGQVEEALLAGASHLLLDNFSPAQVKLAVKLVAGRARLEASGGLGLDDVADYAAAGADDLSVGALTHSVKQADLSMELEIKTGDE